MKDERQQSYGISPPINMPSEKADLLDKINPEEVVNTIYHGFMGEQKINGDWVQISAFKNRALSPKGAMDMALLMLPVSSQNVALGKLKDHEIRARALSIANTAQTLCIRNWLEYNIKGVDQLRFIHEIVFSNTFITLKQSEGEGIRRLLGSIGSGEIGNQPQETAGYGVEMFRR